MKKQKYNLENLIKEFSPIYYQNSDLTTKNFPVPDIIETKGMRIIKMDKYFSSQEALDRIKAEGCRPANIYELLIWAKDNQKKGQWIVAFGSEWEDAGGDRAVPLVDAGSDGDFRFDLGYFEGAWDDGHCMLCVCDKTLEPKTLKVPSTSAALTLSQGGKNINFDELKKAIEVCKDAGYKVIQEL